MPFDPFGDFETRGYLRNLRGYKTISAAKRFEHGEYYENIQLVRESLSTTDVIGYPTLRETHRKLFSSVYPWAGQDRATLRLEMAIVRGRLHFASPDQIERLVSQALTLANDPAVMAKQPGVVLGDLAYAHPFIEGNGRTFLAVVTELARRAGISIDWSNVPLRRYLSALTKEIVLPGEDNLDIFLAPHVRPNPDKVLIEQHQPVFARPNPATRAVAHRDPVRRSGP